jgi:hypothetical protein
MKRQATEVGRPGSGVSTPITSVVPSSVHKAVVNKVDPIVKTIFQLVGAK